MIVHVLIASVVALAVICVGQAFIINHISEDRESIQERLNQSAWSNEQLHEDIAAMVNAAPDIPSPTQDPFLEMADLRRQLEETANESTRRGMIVEGLHEQLGSERRSNASLRGTITRMTPKKKVKDAR